jgi:hypothetical protein
MGHTKIATRMTEEANADANPAKVSKANPMESPRVNTVRVSPSLPASSMTEVNALDNILTKYDDGRLCEGKLNDSQPSIQILCSHLSA